MNRLPWALAGLCLVAGAIVLVRSRGPGPLFYREDVAALPRDTGRFRSDAAQGRLYYQSGGSEEWLDKLPNFEGACFQLRRLRRVRFAPRHSRTNGLYSFVYFRSRGKGERITFTLYRRRPGAQLAVRRVVAAEAAFPLIAEPSLRRGDELVFEFSGNGIVYFSRPLFFRPTPLPEREYVFLVAPDTLRGDLVGAERDGVRLTPCIDRFARDSVSFPNAFASSSWTVPSFTSLFTALYPYRHGVGMGTTLDLSLQPLTSRLAERFITFGYHGGMGLRGFWGYGRHFDHYEDFPQAGPLYPRGGRSLFEKALELVGQAAFPRAFLFLHTYQVHEPYTPPAEFLEKRAPGLPHRRLESFNSRKPERTFMPVGDELRRASRELYEAEVMAFDDYFGWFIGELKRLGVYDRSLIVLTSDHGEEFFEHGGWAHAQSLYNELLRVPLIVKFPGQAHAGARPHALAGLVDVLPTLLDHYRLPPVAGPVDGVSLMPALAGKEPRRHLLADIASCRYNEHFPPRFALFLNQVKAIYNYPPGAGDDSFFAAFGLPPRRPTLEWFDLARDPGELEPTSAGRSPDARELMGELRGIRLAIERAMAGGKFPAGGLDDEARRIFRSLGYL